MIIRTVLADGEHTARQRLRGMLGDETAIEILGESATAPETVELVDIAKPDLLFLDVRMPGKDAFGILEELSSVRRASLPAVVFTTAYDGFASRAFEVHAVDYLLKPFTLERLRTAIRRVTQRLQAQRHFGSAEVGLDRAVPYLDRLIFKSRGRTVFISVSSIRWIGAEENYVRICTETEDHLLREPISRMEERLDPSMFVRVHRSFIVNLRHVKELRSESGGESIVVLMNGQKLAMSRSYRSRLNEWLTQPVRSGAALCRGGDVTTGKTLRYVR
ncbi:MAG TPA: LytTR family DNA-binding domain-containing protein [Acidobacteriaceae bacterium]|jgi:two-component system LytT family response regulator